MRERITALVIASLGLGSMIVGVLGTPDAAAGPDVCVYGAARAPYVSTTVVRDDDCPTLPPDREHPCPGGVWVHEWEESSTADYDVMVCVRGL